MSTRDGRSAIAAAPAAAPAADAEWPLATATTATKESPTQAAAAHQGPRRVVLIQPRTIWLAAAVAVGLALTWIVVSNALTVLILLFMAVVVAEGLRPLVDWLARRRLPRPVAVLLLYLVGFLMLGLLGWLLVRPLRAELAAFVDHLPRYVAQTQRLVDDVQQAIGVDLQVGQLLGALPAQSQQLLAVLLRGPVVLIGVVSGALAILLVAFFWLTGTSGLQGFLVGLLPAAAQAPATATFDEVGDRLGGYLRGLVFNMVVIGVLSGVGLALLGVPYPLVLGVLAGLTEAIPIVGPLAGGSVAVVVALVTQDPLKAGEVALLYLAIQQIEGNTLVPLVMQRAVGLNPLAVVTALLLGGALLGVLGAVLAVPLAAVLQVLVLRVLAPLARRAAADRDSAAAARGAGAGERRLAEPQ